MPSSRTRSRSRSAMSRSRTTVCRLWLVQQPEHHSAGNVGVATLLFVFQAGFLLVPFSDFLPPSATRTCTSRVLNHPGVLSQKFLTIRPPIHPVSLKRGHRACRRRRPELVEGMRAGRLCGQIQASYFRDRTLACLPDTSSVLPFFSNRSYQVGPGG